MDLSAFLIATHQFYILAILDNPNAERLLKVACILSLVTVCMNTPKTLKIFPILNYPILLIDTIVTLIFTGEALIRINHMGLIQVSKIGQDRECKVCLSHVCSYHELNPSINLGRFSFALDHCKKRHSGGLVKGHGAPKCRKCAGKSQNLKKFVNRFSFPSASKRMPYHGFWGVDPWPIG